MTQQPGTAQRPFLRWLRAIAQSSTLLGLAMIALIWMSLAFHVEIERESAEQAAIENSRNLARAFDAHLAQSLSDINRTLGVMRAYYLRDPAHFDLRVWNGGNLSLGRDMMQISIIGADGHVKSSSNSNWSPVYVGDRDHFRALAASRDDQLSISKPVVGRMTHRRSIQLSRRIERADGTFDGIITASLDPSYFAKLYDSVAVGADGYIHVVGTDGIIRAAGGSVQEPPGRNLSKSHMFALLKTQPDGWFYSDSPGVDGIRRLIVYRTVKEFPLVVSVGRSSQEIFAAVTAKQRSYNAIAAILTALILAAIGQSIHGALRLGRASEEQCLQNARFDAALNNMPHGVTTYDAEGNFVVANKRYIDMYGVPPELARLGTPLEKLLGHRLMLEGSSGDPAERVRALREKLASGAPVVTLSRLLDGRTISITNLSLPDGGFIAAHEDITGREQAERELADTKNFLDMIIENIPMPLVVKDPRTHTFTFVNPAYEDFIGRTRAELIGATVYDIYPPEYAQYVVDRDTQAATTACAGTGIIKAEIPALTPRGLRIISTVRLAVRGANGEPAHLISVFEDVTDRRQAEEKVVHMALHDALTDLPNRTRFQAHLREALARVEHGEKLAVHCLDLDNFKNINDALGHAVGDELLKEVACRLRGCVRDVDAIARLGGDEFAIIQSPIDDAADAARLAQRIRDEIGRPFDLGGVQAVCNTSIGVALAPSDATEPEALLKQADMALYGAKAEGRGIYRFFQPEMDARMRLRHAIEQDLRDAIAADGFLLHYQPVVDIASGEVACLEALLRWPHRERGLIPPAEFISIAEESGLIIPLGEWVLRRALADAAHWPEHVRIAVNLSPVQFRSRSLAQTVLAACAAARVAPSRLELEVTEAACLAATKDVLATLDQLRHLGVKIVMDDFGTGYSSLNYLRRFRFDKIKIDRSFVRDLTDRGSLSGVIVEAVVRLACALDVTTTAEGVETVEQLDIIRAAGVTQMQGFLYSPARPLEEIDALFAAEARAVAVRKISAA